MKIKVLPLLLLFSITACSPFGTSRYGKLPTSQPTPNISNQSAQSVKTWQMSPNHKQHVNALSNEAKRLSAQVSSKAITKVQAAQLLNQFRINNVGRNTIDDSVYETYLKSVVQSQAGKISSAQSKEQIQSALATWQIAWQSMGNNRPTNPAFTNFLLKTMGMKQLQ